MTRGKREKKNLKYFGPKRRETKTEERKERGRKERKEGDQANYLLKGKKKKKKRSGPGLLGKAKGFLHHQQNLKKKKKYQGNIGFHAKRKKIPPRGIQGVRQKKWLRDLTTYVTKE